MIRYVSHCYPTHREDDLEVVSELAVLANPHAQKERYREHIFDELKDNPDLSFVATIGEKVRGYVQGGVRDDMSTLEDLAVAEDYQNKRIGTQLLGVELEALQTKGRSWSLRALPHFGYIVVAIWTFME